MSLQVAEIIFNYTPHKTSKELIDFLDRHMENAIIKGQMKFRLQITRKKKKDLDAQGLFKLPAMILGDERFLGIKSIINEISQKIKYSRTKAPVKNEAEILEDFQKQMINEGVKQDSKGKFVVNDDDDDRDDDASDFSKNLNNKVLQESQRRGLNVQSSFGDEVENATRMKSSRKSKKDNGYDEDEDDFKPRRRNNVEPGDMKTLINQQRINSADELKDIEMQNAWIDNLGGSIDD